MSEVDALLATVVDDVLREDLREWYEERAAICEYDGVMGRERAERIALERLKQKIVQTGAVTRTNETGSCQGRTARRPIQCQQSGHVER